MIEENALVVVILIAICLITDLIILILARYFPRYRATVPKIQRFEAGNPPVGIPKWTLPMQYLGFMLMFMAAEPILVIVLLISAIPKFGSYLVTIIAFVLLLPVIYVAYRYSEEIARLRGGTYG